MQKPLLEAHVVNIEKTKMAERPKELTSASARAQKKALLGDDDATMVFETSKEVSVVNTFDRMNLREDLIRGIYAYGQFKTSMVSSKPAS